MLEKNKHCSEDLLYYYHELEKEHDNEDRYIRREHLRQKMTEVSNLIIKILDYEK